VCGESPDSKDDGGGVARRVASVGNVGFERAIRAAGSCQRCGALERNTVRPGVRFDLA
jgi:hypothetical protein